MESEIPKLEYKSPSPSPSISPSPSPTESVSSSVSSTISSVSESVSSGIESSGVSSFFDFSSYSLYDVLRIFAIVLILSFLGINFFGYLGKVTEAVRDFLKPILGLIGYGAAETTKSIVNVSAAGTKGVVDVASGTVVGGVNLLEKGLSKKGKTMNKIDDHSKIDMKLLEKAAENQNRPKKEKEEPEPDDSGSRIQANKAKIKSGFCYIGEDRGYRRCIAVGEGDKCISGDIFPTDEICVNPSLRE